MFIITLKNIPFPAVKNIKNFKNNKINSINETNFISQFVINKLKPILAITKKLKLTIARQILMPRLRPM